jgi:hypothetical protein
MRGKGGAEEIAKKILLVDDDQGIDCDPMVMGAIRQTFQRERRRRESFGKSLGLVLADQFGKLHPVKNLQQPAEKVSVSHDFGPSLWYSVFCSRNHIYHREGLM